MRVFETHVQYNPEGDFYVIRSRLLDGTGERWIHRSLNWLKKYLNKDIPYNWDIVKSNPDKWFLL